MICERQLENNPGRFHYKCKTVQPLVLWVTNVFGSCIRLQTQPKIFQINLETQNNFLAYGKNTYHTISIYSDRKL